MDATLLLITSIASIQTTFAEVQLVRVKVDETVLLEGDNFTALCSFKKPISSCEWDVLEPNEFQVVEPEGNLTEGIKYHGRGLNFGECGITIINVTEIHDRLFVCKLGLTKPIDNNTTLTDALKTYKYGYVHPVIARDPKGLRISVDRIDPVNIKYPNNTFEENKRILAQCNIALVRPAVNISWFIGDERIEDGYSELEVEYVCAIGNVCDFWETVRRNLTRNLTYTDNGKDLICMVHHKPFGRWYISNPTFTLDVYFPPKLKKIEQSAFTIGQTGKIVVTTYSNPKPSIVEWLVDGKKIQKGTRDETGKFRAHYLNPKGKHTWEAVLQVDDVNSEDVKRNYTFKAENTAGEIQIRGLMPVCHASFPNLTTCLALSAPCPTCFTEATTCPSPFFDFTASSPTPFTSLPATSPAKMTAYSPFSHGFTTTPPPAAETAAYSSHSTCLATCPADVTAWTIAGIFATILLIIFVRSAYSRLPQRANSPPVEIGLEHVCILCQDRTHNRIINYNAPQSEHQ